MLQEAKAEKRRKTIAERCGEPKSQKDLGDTQLRALCQEYHKRICLIESQKYDLEKEVELKDYQINELNIAVNDMKGKL